MSWEYIRRRVETPNLPRSEFSTRYRFRVFSNRTYARCGVVELSSGDVERAFASLRETGLVAYEGHWLDQNRPFRPWRKMRTEYLTEILRVCISLEQQARAINVLNASKTGLRE